MNRLVVPRGIGPWSYRRFTDERGAREFFRRLPSDNPPPIQLEEPSEAPDDTVLEAGTWVVFYQPIQN